MVYVTKKKGETKDSLFRKFTKTFIDEEIVDEVRKKMFYKKPSILKKEHDKERRIERSKMRRRAAMAKKRLK